MSTPGSYRRRTLLTNVILKSILQLQETPDPTGSYQTGARQAVTAARNGEVKVVIALAWLTRSSRYRRLSKIAFRTPKVKNFISEYLGGTHETHWGQCLCIYFILFLSQDVFHLSAPFFKCKMIKRMFSLLLQCRYKMKSCQLH